MPRHATPRLLLCVISCYIPTCNRVTQETTSVRLHIEQFPPLPCHASNLQLRSSATVQYIAQYSHRSIAHSLHSWTYIVAVYSLCTSPHFGDIIKMIVYYCGLVVVLLSLAAVRAQHSK